MSLQIFFSASQAPSATVHPFGSTVNGFGEDENYQIGLLKKRGTPKWMVKIMENPINIDDLGPPLFLETPILTFLDVFCPLISGETTLFNGVPLGNHNIIFVQNR